MISDLVQGWEALSAGQRLDQLAALDSEINAAQGRRAVLLSVMARLDNSPVPVAGGMVPDPVAEEVAVVSCTSPQRAAGDVETARVLAARLPGVLAKVADGTVALFTAAAVAELLPDEVDPTCDPTPEIQRRILPKLEGRTVAQVRRSMRRILARVVPGYVRKQHERAKAARGICLIPLPDGLTNLSITLPAAQARYVYAACDAAARHQRRLLVDAKAGGQEVEVPRVGALRADAIVAMATHAHDHGLPGWNVTPKLNVAVIVDLPTALGLADNPGQLPGYGTIPGAVARELAADGRWGRWLTDRDGNLLSASPYSYTPSAGLARFIKARDQHCRFPNCQSLAWNPTAEIDHAQPFNHDDPHAGGQTVAANLGVLCKRHHQLKTAGLWTITESHPDGSCVWQSPTGRTYIHRAENLLARSLTFYDEDDDPPEPPDHEYEPDPDPPPPDVHQAGPPLTALEHRLWKHLRQHLRLVA